MSKLAKALTAAAGNAGESLYVEDVFSTYLYEGGNGSGTNQAVNVVNDVNLNEEGGLIWLKRRDVGNSHALIDTERGRTQWLNTDTTSAAISATGIDSFNTDGFTVSSTGYGETNNTSGTYASWTFRKAEKFFDVVTYTGNGAANRQVPHNLGSVPGCIILKRYDTADDWKVYHVGADATAPEDYVLELNSTAARLDSISAWNDTAPTDSNFTVNSGGSYNASGGTYVAYLFASDAGGFGDDGSESIIKCGSYTGNGNVSVNSINVGFEPQFVLIKNASSTGSWLLHDIMRGMPVGADSTKTLYANVSNAEASPGVPRVAPTATGFDLDFTASGDLNASGNTYIYIAIRRPMKTPESGTEVFAIDTRASSGGTLAEFISGFPVDMYLRHLVSASFEHRAHTRLLGQTKLITNTTAAEVSDTTVSFASNVGAGPSGESANSSVLAHMFKRATGFFDVVAYTGTGVATSFNHNLGVIPQLQIIKRRDSTSAWYVNAYDLSPTSRGFLNLANNFATSGTEWSGSDATTFSVYSGGLANINVSGATYINYLFASVAGVSKVGSYTGTGADLNVDCGFSAGARFILIKRTDSTGDWYVWDSVRGIVAGNDPYLLLNSTAAEVTTTDYIDPLASGFTVTSTAPAALNASGGSYIFLAIA